MSFSDDDLKRLKDELSTIEWNHHRIDALIDRLEAAEAVIDWVDKNVPGHWDSVMSYQAWRKAAGK